MPRRKVRISTGSGELRTSGGERPPKRKPRPLRKAAKREPKRRWGGERVQTRPSAGMPAAVSDTPRAQRRITRQRRRALADAGPRGGGVNVGKLLREIGSNAKTEAGDIVRGLPKAGYLTVKDIGKGLSEGEDPQKAVLTAFSDPQVAYAKKKYGPLLPGGRPARETLEEIKRTPISTALDVAAPVSVTLGAAGRVTKFSRAKGGPVKRYRASKTLPKTRTLRTGKAEAQFPASPSALTRGGQRGRDVLSKKIGTAPSRVAKQRARQIKVDIRRRQAAFEEDIGKVEKVPRKQRAATFYEAQLPKAARGPKRPPKPRPDYRGQHTSPDPKGGAPLHELTRVYPADVYGPDAARLYGHGGPDMALDRQTTRLVQSLRGKPDAQVTVYRGVPPEIREIQPGDWVTPNRRYAEQHAASEEGWRVIERKVPAREVYGSGDSIHEYGWHPKPQPRGGGLERVEADLRTRADKLTRRAQGRLQARLQTRMDKLDAQYEQLVAQVAERVDPYVSAKAKQTETLYRNRTRNRLKGGIRRGDMPTVSAEIRDLAEARIAKTVEKNPDLPAAKLIREREILRDHLNEIGEASMEARRHPMGRPKSAQRLLIQAERVKQGRQEGFDPTEPVDAIGRLETERERIFADAGKLTAETAERMRGSFAREMGYEDTTGAGYIGHRTKEAPRSIQRLGQTRVGQRFIGPPKTPPGIGQQRTGRAYRSGKVRADPKVAVEDWQHAQRYEFQNIARKELAKFGEPIQGRPKPGYYVLNPEGHKLPRAWKEADPREAARKEGIDVEAVVEGDLREYIQNYIARAGTPEAAALLEKSPGSIVQVSPKVVHKFFNQFEGRAGVSFGRGTRQLDAVNDLMRFSTIYSNPGYIPAQWVGNASMSIAHQAFYLPGNLVRAANVLRGKHGRELKARILVETGAQGTSAIVSEGQAVASRVTRSFAGGLSKIADDPWRVAAWYHEARKANYRTTKQQLDLLRKAERGDKQAQAVANDLRQRVNNAMVDFERLGPAERAVAARFLFVLPWIRGAVRYPGRFALDYPGRTALAVHAAEEAERDPSLDIATPEWLGQAFPVGPQKAGMQRVVNPRSTFTASTPLESMQTLAQAATGEGRGTLSDFLAPQYRMLLHGLEGRNRFGQKVGTPRAVQEDIENISPLRTLLQEVADPSRAPKVYGPQTQGEVLKRRLGRGVIPFQIDVAEARKQAARDMPPEKRLHQKHVDHGKLILEGARQTGLLKKGQPLPPQLRQALKVREERFQNRRDAKGARERFEADVRFLRRKKLIDAKAAATALNWMRSEPRDALVQDELDHISRKYFSPLYGDALSDARRKLKEKGYDLPELH